jgi:DNA polymerase III sliding clamp (beta) subunit (PCNA family)
LEAAEHGAVEQVIACQGWQLGCAIGMNTRYLLHAVTCLRGNEVTLQLTDATAPVHLEDHELRMVIMPMRILGSVDYHPATSSVQAITTATESPNGVQP